jgi:hypothetical protein
MSRTLDIAAMCEGKRRYRSRGEALRVRNRRQRCGATKQLRAYQCDFCHRWHLTSQKPRKHD